jgi:hypothetical protein
MSTLPPPPREQSNSTQWGQWYEKLWREIQAGGNIGDHKLWFSDTLPEHGHWAWCDGTDYAAEDFPEWFAIHGVRFGAPSAGRFNTLDARGRFMRFWDDGAGRDPGAASRTAMATGGETGDEIGSVQSDALQGHYHQFKDTQDGSLVPGALLDRNFGTGSGAAGSNRSVGTIAGPTTDGTNGTPRTASETRPVNFYGALITRLA